MANRPEIPDSDDLVVDVELMDAETGFWCPICESSTGVRVMVVVMVAGEPLNTDHVGYCSCCEAVLVLDG